MKKVKKTLKQALSVILVAAMVVTLTPDVALTSYAAEDEESSYEEVEEEVIEEDDEEVVEEKEDDKEDVIEEEDADDENKGDEDSEEVNADEKSDEDKASSDSKETEEITEEGEEETTTEEDVDAETEETLMAEDDLDVFALEEDVEALEVATLTVNNSVGAGIKYAVTEDSEQQPSKSDYSSEEPEVKVADVLWIALSKSSTKTYVLDKSVKIIAEDSGYVYYGGITVEENTSITISEKYTLTVEPDDSDAIKSLSGADFDNSNEALVKGEVTLTITPEDNYTLTGIEVNGKNVTFTGTEVTVDVTKNTTVKVYTAKLADINVTATNATVKYTTDGVNYSNAISGDAKVPAGQITLQVSVVKADYEIGDVKVGESTITGRDVTPSDNDTDSVFEYTITTDAEKATSVNVEVLTKYEVTLPKVKGESETATQAVDSAVKTIAYADNSTKDADFTTFDASKATSLKVGKFTKGHTLYVKITPVDGKKITVIADSKEIAEKDGMYAVPVEEATEITVKGYTDDTEDQNIFTVKTKNIASFTVNGKAYVAGSDDDENTENYTADEDVLVKAKKGTAYAFTFTPDDNYRIKSVKRTSNSATNEVKAVDGVYTITPTAETTVEVTLEQYADVEFTLSDDVKSVAVYDESKHAYVDVPEKDGKYKLTEQQLVGSTIKVKVVGKDNKKPGNSIVGLTVDSTVSQENDTTYYTCTIQATNTISLTASDAYDITYEVDEGVEKLTTDSAFQKELSKDAKGNYVVYDITTDAGVYVKLADAEAVITAKVDDAAQTVAGNKVTLSTPGLTANTTVTITTDAKRTIDFSGNTTTTITEVKYADGKYTAGSALSGDKTVTAGEVIYFTVTPTESNKLRTVQFDDTGDADPVDVETISATIGEAKEPSTIYKLTAEKSGAVKATADARKSITVTVKDNIDDSQVTIKKAAYNEEATSVTPEALGTLTEDDKLFLEVTVTAPYKLKTLTATATGEDAVQPTLTTKKVGEGNAAKEYYVIDLKDVTTAVTLDATVEIPADATGYYDVTVTGEDKEHVTVTAVAKTSETKAQQIDDYTIRTNDTAGLEVTITAKAGYELLTATLNGEDQINTDTAANIVIPVSFKKAGSETEYENKAIAVTAQVKPAGAGDITIKDDNSIATLIVPEQADAEEKSVNKISVTAGATKVDFELWVAEGTTDVSVKVDGVELTTSLSYVSKADKTPKDGLVIYSYTVIPSALVGKTITVTGTAPSTEDRKTTLTIATVREPAVGINVYPQDKDYNFDFDKAQPFDKKFSGNTASYSFENLKDGGIYLIVAKVGQNYFLDDENFEFWYTDAALGVNYYTSTIEIQGEAVEDEKGDPTGKYAQTIEVGQAQKAEQIVFASDMNYNAKTKKYVANIGDTATIKAMLGDEIVPVTVTAKVKGKELEKAPYEVAEDGVVTITIPDTLGTDLVVTAETESGYKQSYTFAVNKVVETITVKGLQTDAETKALYAKQTLDSVVTYQINEKRADYSVITVAVDKAEAKVTQPNEKGQFTVKVPATSKQTYKVTLTSTVDKTGEEATPVSTAFEVRTVEPTVPTKAIAKVDLASAKDTSLGFKITLDKKLVIPATVGNLFYKVELTPVAATEDKPIPAELVGKFVATPNSGAVNVTSTDAITTAEIPVFTGITNALKTWEFDVKVTLTQKYDSKENVIATFETTKPVSTKAAYYEDKLTLTKGTTTIYTGQASAENPVLVATAKYGKNTTYTKVQEVVQILDKNNVDVTGWFAYDEDDGKILITGTPSVNAGKAGTYTLKVSPVTVEEASVATMYAAPASLKFTLVNGIESISVYDGGYTEQTAFPIYKASNKAASLKLTTEYNGGFKDTKPKTAKATYVAEALDQYGDWSADAFKAKFINEKGKATVTVNNKSGAISIAKDYAFAESAIDNTFRIVTTAADYTGNTVSNTGYYIVTGEAITLGNVYLAKYVNGVYKVDTAKTTFKMSEISDYVVIVTKSKDIVANGETYFTDEDLELNFEPTFSNKKFTLWNPVPAKNITITATAIDGSKNKNANKYSFTVEYDKAAKVGIYKFISDEGVSGLGMTPVDANGKTVYHFTASSQDDAIAFRIGVADEADDKLKSLEDSYNSYGNSNNYNITASVSGGKVISDKYDHAEGLYTFVPTAAKGTIKIQDKISKATATIDWVNDGFVTGKAPSVKLDTKKTGTLYADVATKQSAYLTIGKTDWDYVNITCDLVAKNNEDFATLPSEILSPLDPGYLPAYISVEDLSKYGLAIIANADAGSEKLNFTFGTLENGEFVAKTKAVSLTLKVVAVPNVKLVTSYTIDPKVGYACLTSKPDVSDKWNIFYTSKLLNANVKGQPNEFLKYFELYGTYNDLIKIKDKTPGVAYTAKEIEDAIKAGNGTGYISWYNPKTGDTEYTKITIKTKKVSYKASDIKVLPVETVNGLTTSYVVSGSTTITNGKYVVDDIKWVYAEVPEDAKNKIDASPLTAVVNGDDTVSITVPDAARARFVEGKATKVNLYVVTDENYLYRPAADTIVAKDAAAKEAGTLVTLNYTILSGKGNKVAFDKRDLNVTNWYYSQNSKKWNAWIDFDYTMEGVQIDTVEVLNTVKGDQYIEAVYYPGNEYVQLVIDKPTLLAQEDVETLLDSQVNMKLVVKFKNIAATTTLEAQEQAIKVKVPTVQTYKEAIDAIKAGEADVLKKLVLFNEDYYEDYRKADAIKDAIEGLFDPSSGAEVTVTKEAGSEADSSNDGYYIASFKVVNSELAADKQSETAYTSDLYTWKIEKLSTSKTFSQVVTAVSTAAGTLTATNATKETDIVAALQAAATAVDPKANVSIINYNLHPATEGQTGSVTGTIKVSKGWFAQDTVTLNVEIAALGDSDDLNSVETAIKNALNGADGLGLDNTITVEGVKAIITKAINNDAIKVTYSEVEAEKLTVVKSTTAQTGKISGKFTLTKAPTGTAKERKLVVDLTGGNAISLKALDSTDNIKSNIKNALEAMIITNGIKETDIISAAKAAYYNDEYTVVKVKETTSGSETTKSWTLSPATVKAEGSLTVTLTVSTSGETPVTIETDSIVITIPVLSQTLAEAKAAADAVLAEQDENKVDKITSATTTAEIKTAVEAKVDTTIYTVTVTEKVTKAATATEKGTKVFTVRIEKTVKDANYGHVESPKEVSIPMIGSGASQP